MCKACKASCKFLKFDIVDFYPSITVDLLSSAINFAREFAPVNDDIINIIMHCRKSFLFCENNTWVKKSGAQFDVAMGSFDGAEICELVGLFLLYQLSDLFGKAYVGLYRDDGLSVLRNTSSPEADKMRKVVVQFFQKHALSVTIDTNLTQTDFLDVTFYLSTEKFWPYRRPNDQPLYINVKSNHPPMIIKQLPSMIEKRVSQVACDKQEFDRSIPLYNHALQQSGYNVKLEYQPNSNDHKVKRIRKRNIVWFNPPFNSNVNTNVGKIFFPLLHKHFPPITDYIKSATVTSSPQHGQFYISSQ